MNIGVWMTRDNPQPDVTVPMFHPSSKCNLLHVHCTSEQRTHILTVCDLPTVMKEKSRDGLEACVYMDPTRTDCFHGKRSGDEQRRLHLKSGSWSSKLASWKPRNACYGASQGHSIPRSK